MSTILLVAAVIVLVNMLRRTNNTVARLRQQEVSREILELYFENLNHGSAAAIAEYLGRPLGDVHGALRLLQARHRVHYSFNAYGFPVWYRNAGLF